MMGLPFFRAGDRPDAGVRLLLPEQGVDPTELLARNMSPPFFPISVEELRGGWTVGTYDEGRFEAEGFEVLARAVPHKGGRTMGVRVSDGRTSVAYLPDHAPHSLGPGPDGFGEHHDAAVDLVRGVDLLIHGAQYTSAELPTRFTFGHAAANYCVGLAQAQDVGRLVLFHHDPWRTDDQVTALRAEVAEGASVPVEVAVEGSVIDL
jgi:phosphoribosyl 1,2-cyclic phosphodiesterase